MHEPVLIQLIADYGVGDPAYVEVFQKILGLDPTAKIFPVNVPRFSTVATGLWIEQLSTVNAFPGLVIFSNTAPRTNLTEDQKKTFGGNFGKFVFAELKGGVLVMAVYVGYTFSFIKNYIKTYKLINVKNEGSQFRSRDYYPDVVVGIYRGNRNYLGSDISIATIPDPPESVVGFIDGYGNLKTTIRKSKFGLTSGTKVLITINHVTHEAMIAADTYHVKDGELSIAPGSSGGDDRYLEIWVRGESAWKAFGRPYVEEKITIKILK